MWYSFHKMKMLLKIISELVPYTPNISKQASQAEIDRKTVLNLPYGCLDSYINVRVVFLIFHSHSFSFHQLKSVIRCFYFF